MHSRVMQFTQYIGIERVDGLEFDWQESNDQGKGREHSSRDSNILDMNFYNCTGTRRQSKKKTTATE